MKKGVKLSNSAIYASMAFVCWLVCIVFEWNLKRETSIYVFSNSFVNSILSSGFVVFCFLFYRFEIKDSRQVVDLLELLWRSFLTSIATFSLVFILRLAEIGNNFASILSSESLQFWGYHFYIAAIVIFQANLFYIYKNLSFYPKVKSLEKQWQIVEITLLLLLIYCTFYPENRPIIKFICCGISVLVSLSVAVRFKWIVYLDFKQKIQAIFLITSVLLIGLFFLQLFWSEEVIHKTPYTIFDNLFYYSQFTFFGVYSLFSLLMLFFNIPASSIFDKKMSEISHFQRFSEAMQQEGDKKNLIFQLIDGSIGISAADAAWLEYYVKDEKKEVYTRNIEATEISILRKKLAKSPQELRKSGTIIRDLLSQKIGTKKIEHLTVISFPLNTSNSSFGFVVLLKYIQDGFEKDIVRILRTYTHQAALSLENMSLISDAIEKERYLEEIKISKKIQKSLLPKLHLDNETLKISFYSKSTGTVGGDFFDYCASTNLQYWIAIGDVAGKGTSAAFLMAQLKGIFRSLVQVCSGPRNLVIRANLALAYSTEKTAFITLSAFLVDTDKKHIKHVRAGHCQGIFYRKQTNEHLILEPKGMGLGLVKDDTFKSYIEEQTLEYESGDALFLYTDGVTEARNKKGDMFGINNLLGFIYENNMLDTETIVKNFSFYLTEFCGENEEDDDITFLAIRL